MIGVADREIEPDHVVLERHRGVDRGGAGMIAVAGADPADAIVASQRDRLLDGAGYDEAAEPVIAIDDSGRPRLPDHRDLGPRVEPARLDAADVLRQAKDAVPVGAADVRGGHQLRRLRRIRLRNADRAIGGVDKADQVGVRDARDVWFYVVRHDWLPHSREGVADAGPVVDGALLTGGDRDHQLAPAGVAQRGDALPQLLLGRGEG